MNGSRSGSGPVVLVVEDEHDLADLYADWLRADHEVRVAYTGEEALDLLDGDVDVALLDRRLPDLTGEMILSTIRKQQYECRVAMVTAVDPDFDIVEMGFDDYLTKPVSKAELLDTVSELRGLSNYDVVMQEYYALASKIAALKSNTDAATLESSEEYAELVDRFEEVDRQASEQIADISDTDELGKMYRRLSKHWPGSDSSGDVLGDADSSPARR